MAGCSRISRRSTQTAIAVGFFIFRRFLKKTIGAFEQNYQQMSSNSERILIKFWRSFNKRLVYSLVESVCEYSWLKTKKNWPT
jgi:hypothetical protein